SIQTTVDSLRNDDKVDLVIALSHSGTDASGNGEDHVLAQKSKGIDIIVSGHTHVELPMPVTVTNAGGGSTYIVSTGAYGLNLGHMELTYTRGKGLAVDSYALEKIDDTVAGDATVQARIAGYVTEMNTTFNAVGLPKYFDPVGGSGFDLPNTPFQETNLGDLVTDAYLATANAVGTPTAIGVEANGNIRAPLLKGKTGALAFADVFNVEPLGIGPDQKPGYPLVVVYLTAKDLVNGLSLSAAAADPASVALGIRDDDYFIQVSGVKYTYDLTHGATPLQRLTHVDVCPPGNCSACTGSPDPCTVFDGTAAPDDTIRYPTVMTYYLASLFGLVSSATGGALSVTPKDATGNPYNNTTNPLSNAILTGPNGEVKNWQALVGVISKFPSGGSGPVIPASYATPAGRITKLP
ncbi:MAG TPA: 5'-nucleotidase C-terminal domain-containing protein, partial [Labilithrix sp.]